MVAISRQLLEGELRELAGPEVKLTLTFDTEMKVTSAMRFTDKAIKLKLNPARIKTQAKLDEHMEYFRHEITRGL